MFLQLTHIFVVSVIPKSTVDDTQKKPKLSKAERERIRKEKQFEKNQKKRDRDQQKADTFKALNPSGVTNYMPDETDFDIGCFRRCDGGESGLLDDVLPDARRQAVFAGRVREARCRWFRDDQGRRHHRGRVQNPGLVPEHARRPTAEALIDKFRM